MKHHLSKGHRRTRAVIGCCAAIFVANLFFTSLPVSAQSRTTKTKSFPARKNVRLQLTNRSGAIIVETWDKAEIRVKADMEASAGSFAPELNEYGLIIDMVQHGRSDAGDVNFHVHVPVDSTVDIETKRGDIKVRNVQGALVRARVSSEGDIELTGIRATTVMARNTMGNILFDGELRPGGKVELTSTAGDTSVRLPATTGFFLTAAAPMARRIDLGGFAGMGECNSISGNRKVVCKMGDGAASINVFNLRGPITFIRR